MDETCPCGFLVWWIPQVPGKPFRVKVKTVEQGLHLLDVLAEYDAFQFKNNIKPDYSNVGGLMVFEDGEWVDWADEDGNSSSDLLSEKRYAEFPKL